MALSGFLALVPAAGRGQRFGGALPKQLVPVAGRPILHWSVGRLLEAGAGRVVVALPEDRVSWGRSLWREESRVLCVGGGSTRQESVARCLAALEPRRDDEWVLVHDGARPVVAVDDVRATIAAAQADGWDGAVLGRPASDTLKRIEAGLIVGTADRGRFFRAETPQVFRRSLLERALLAASRDGFVGSDESSLVERLPGARIAPVVARFANPKLTEAADLAVITSLLTATA